MSYYKARHSRHWFLLMNDRGHETIVAYVFIREHYDWVGI